MERTTKNLVVEVSIGILLFTLLVIFGAFFLYPDRTVYAGLLLGMLLALAMFLSMAVVLDKSMKTGDPKIVQKRSVMSGVIRYILLVLILITVTYWFSDWFHPVAVVIGVLGLKVGAYFQPILHKIAVRGTIEKK
jgi:small-conductance mechanosensitive channel